MDRLLAEIERSPELKQQWSRMCLARDALAGARVRADRPSICEGVMEALGEEAPSPKVVPLVARRRAVAWRPMVSMATAAGVAAVAFYLGYRSPAVEPVTTAATASFPTTVSAPRNAPGLVEASVPVASTATAPRLANAAESLEEWDSGQLNTYLIDYSSYRAGAGMADTLGYARFAAHTAEYTSDR